jgi:hypothetical protein
MAQHVELSEIKELMNLNWDGALRLMNQGFAVKLPEFTGWWFIKGGIILVRTRTGKLVNTPHIELHKNRKDWSVSFQSMDFSQALRFAMNDVPTFRTHYDPLTGESLPIVPLAKKKYIRKKEDVLYIYQTSTDDYFLEDLTNDDWLMTLRDALVPGKG